jgi:hypothetical protein
MKKIVLFEQFIKDLTKEYLVGIGNDVSNNNGYLNCQLFTQLVTKEPSLLELPKVDFDDIEIGDVMAFGGDNTYSRHYSIYLGNNEVMEVEEWGEPMSIKNIEDVIDYWEKPKSIHRPEYDII